MTSSFHELKKKKQNTNNNTLHWRGCLSINVSWNIITQNNSNMNLLDKNSKMRFWIKFIITYCCQWHQYTNDFIAEIKIAFQMLHGLYSINKQMNTSCQPNIWPIFCIHFHIFLSISNKTHFYRHTGKINLKYSSDFELRCEYKAWKFSKIASLNVVRYHHKMTIKAVFLFLQSRIKVLKKP